MKLISFFLLFTLVSCKVPKETEQAATTVVHTTTEEIVADLQGNYAGCVPSPNYAGYYTKVNISVLERNITYTVELSASPTCATSYYKNTYSYDIEKADYENPGDSEIINLDLKMKHFKVVFYHSYYISQNYCLLNDWTLNVEKNLTGLYCPNLLSGYDNFHTSFRAAGSLAYFQIRHTPTSFAISLGAAESGDSDADRLRTLRAEVPKI